jgi:hypothetical protein
MRVAGFALALVSLAALAAGAKAEETNSEYAFINAAQGCQLSGPTIITKAAPRATGFRNDGDDASFVICGFWIPDQEGVNFYTATVYLDTTDGAAHDVTCTGVNGIAGIYPQKYVAKTVHVEPGTAGTNWITYLPADFGGVNGVTDIPQSDAFSITCALPPRTAIVRIGGDYIRGTQ